MVPSLLVKLRGDTVEPGRRQVIAKLIGGGEGAFGTGWETAQP
jgi:hypothetical protein